MAEESAPTTRGLPPGVRWGLLLAGLAVAAWAMTRVVLLVSGVDAVVSAHDPHGYTAIFSLLLAPVLLLAVALLVAGLLRGGRLRVGPGIALALFAAAVGVAIVAAAVIDQRGRAAAR